MSKRQELWLRVGGMEEAVGKIQAVYHQGVGGYGGGQLGFGGLGKLGALATSCTSGTRKIWKPQRITFPPG